MPWERKTYVSVLQEKVGCLPWSQLLHSFSQHFSTSYKSEPGCPGKKLKFTVRFLFSRHSAGHLNILTDKVGNTRQMTGPKLHRIKLTELWFKSSPISMGSFLSVLCVCKSIKKLILALLWNKLSLKVGT